MCSSALQLKFTFDIRGCIKEPEQREVSGVCHEAIGAKDVRHHEAGSTSFHELPRDRVLAAAAKQ